VVGHSGGGYLLPLVAAQRALRRIVFLAAMLPQMGKSFLDQLRDDPTIFNPEWIGKDPSRDDAAAMYFLFHDCSGEVAKWALTTRIRLPLEKMASEVYPLQRWPAVASSYIVCSEDRTINPEWSRRAGRERLGVDPIEFPAGHCPHISQPQKLAKILSDLT
jgi:pimeloyl-ACP methyl ester carboxylesterase